MRSGRSGAPKFPLVPQALLLLVSSSFLLPLSSKSSLVCAGIARSCSYRLLASLTWTCSFLCSSRKLSPSVGQSSSLWAPWCCGFNACLGLYSSICLCIWCVHVCSCAEVWGQVVGVASVLPLWESWDWTLLVRLDGSRPCHHVFFSTLHFVFILISDIHKLYFLI